MPKYTIKEKVETFLGGVTISESLDDLIDGVEKYIDNYTERNFNADDEASMRVFSGDNTGLLLIDDAVEITKVELGNDSYGDNFSELVLNIDYKLMPENYEVKNQPITKIFLRNNIWGVGIQNHKITAKWGYSSITPADIVWVATFLAASVYKLGSSGSVGGVSSEKIGEYSVSFNTEKEFSDFKKSTEILDNYKKFYV